MGILKQCFRCLVKVLPQCAVLSAEQSTLKMIHSLVSHIVTEVRISSWKAVRRNVLQKIKLREV